MNWRFRGVCALAIGLALVMQAPKTSAQLPAGSTNAILSFIDASGGHVSVRRHWHGAGGEEVQVFPWTPQWWDGCLPFQNGALMFLVTSPVGYPPPGLTSSEAYTAQYLARLVQSISTGVRQAAAALPAEQSQARSNLDQIIAGMTVPGNPAYEALKAALGQINSMSNYESYGYAAFMFVRWKWIVTLFGAIPAPCADVQVRAVPEGTGIPIVTRNNNNGGGGAADASVPRDEGTAPALAAQRR